MVKLRVLIVCPGRSHELYEKCREAIGREASPTAAAVIDSQSVKSAEKVASIDPPGYDGERRSRARSGTFSSIRKAC
jgi:hypothetical protein